MTITLAESAGFCFGVKRAVEQVYQCVEESYVPVYTFGPIIHNEEVIKELEEKNARIQHDYDTLKMTKMMQVTDGDIEVSRKRVNRLLRDVNKCITLLSEKS